MAQIIQPKKQETENAKLITVKKAQTMAVLLYFQTPTIIGRQENLQIRQKTMQV